MKITRYCPICKHTTKHEMTEHVAPPHQVESNARYDWIEYKCLRKTHKDPADQKKVQELCTLVDLYRDEIYNERDVLKEMHKIMDDK